MTDDFFSRPTTKLGCAIRDDLDMLGVPRGTVIGAGIDEEKGAWIRFRKGYLDLNQYASDRYAFLRSLQMTPDR